MHKRMFRAWSLAWLVCRMWKERYQLRPSAPACPFVRIASQLPISTTDASLSLECQIIRNTRRYSRKNQCFTKPQRRLLRLLTRGLAVQHPPHCLRASPGMASSSPKTRRKCTRRLLRFLTVSNVRSSAGTWLRILQAGVATLVTTSIGCLTCSHAKTREHAILWVWLDLPGQPCCMAHMRSMTS